MPAEKGPHLPPRTVRQPHLSTPSRDTLKHSLVPAQAGGVVNQNASATTLIFNIRPVIRSPLSCFLTNVVHPPCRSKVKVRVVPTNQTSSATRCVVAIHVAGKQPSGQAMKQER